MTAIGTSIIKEKLVQILFNFAILFIPLFFTRLELRD